MSSSEKVTASSLLPTSTEIDETTNKLSDDGANDKKIFYI
jgi:hypothetical protein